MEKKETTEKFDNITETLNQLIEKAQVKAGLLKLEGKQAWEGIYAGLVKINQKLKNSAQKAHQEVDEAQLQAHLGMMEAREEWQEFKGYLQQGVQMLKNERPTFDQAKLQAHLGLMEMDSRWDEKKKEWKQNYEKSIKPEIRKRTEEMEKEMRTFVKSLADQ